MADRDAFDLFHFLGQLNKRNLQAYDKLTPEGQKAAHPFVIMRWLAGTSDEAQIIRLNEFVNKHVFGLGKEKELLFKLLAAACTGKTSRTKWLKGPGSQSKQLALEAIKQWYGCSTREANMYLPRLTSPMILEFGEELGWDKDDMKKLQVELGVEPKPKPKSKK
jgi:hypothetical protein